VYNQTPLHFAAEHGHAEVARVLLEHGADIEAKHIETSLHYAAKRGHEEVVRVLLEHGADVEARDEVQSSHIQHSPYPTLHG
jgi:ankyrin repeat protein